MNALSDRGLLPINMEALGPKPLREACRCPDQLCNGLDLKQCVYWLFPEIDTAQLQEAASGNVSQPAETWQSCFLRDFGVHWYFILTSEHIPLSLDALKASLNWDTLT